MKSILTLVAAAAFTLSPVAFATDSAANDNLGIPSSALLLSAEQSGEVRGTAWLRLTFARIEYNNSGCQKWSFASRTWK